jgi:hypothetical protein
MKAGAMSLGVDDPLPVIVTPTRGSDGYLEHRRAYCRGTGANSQGPG